MGESIDLNLKSLNKNETRTISSSEPSMKEDAFQRENSQKMIGARRRSFEKKKKTGTKKRKYLDLHEEHL